MSSMSKSEGLIICPHCNERLPQLSAKCPFCAEPIETVAPDCAKLETPPASSELKPAPETARTPVGKWRRRLRGVGLLIALLLAAVVLVNVFVYLQENRFWPFATGTSNPAFLGTTFGMSPQEVRRTLKKEGTQLLAFDEYKRVEQTPLIDYFDWLTIYSEDRNHYAELFMPSIELFDTRTEAQFTFRLGRLESVSVHFGSYRLTNALVIVESVKSHLLKTYQFSEREDSKDVRGAYTLKYASANASASLWVNLTDSKDDPLGIELPPGFVLDEASNSNRKRYIILTLFDSKSHAERKQQIKERERKAFGLPD